MTPPSLFLLGVEKQPIVPGPCWLLANQHQGTAIEAGLWVKPPMRLGPRQCGQGFPSLERSRPSSRGLAAPVHRSACLAAAQVPFFSSYSATCDGQVFGSFFVRVFLHPSSVRSPMMVTVFWRSLSSVTGTLEAERDS